MNRYLIAYHSTTSTRPTAEEGKAQRARYEAWLESLADAVVTPSQPLGASRTVASDGVRETAGASRFMGFTVLQAESLEAAVAHAERCPFLDMGYLEVAEMISMG